MVRARKVALPEVVPGVAVCEFEAWLIADHACVQRILGATFPTPPAPESVAPGWAKERLANWIGASPRSLEGSKVRRALAEESDLDAIRARRPSFAEFRREIQRAVSVALP